MLGKFNKAASAPSAAAPAPAATAGAPSSAASAKTGATSPPPVAESKTSAKATVAAPGAAAPLAGENTTTNQRPSDRPGLKQAYTREANKALNNGLTDAIVDLRVSVNELQEADLSRNGYEQILQQDPSMMRKSVNGISTFGNKTSIWIWRRSQGVCSGRLKPIIDIQLAESSVSTDLVISGYTADPNLIAGQTLWIKRSNSDETEKDAIIDLYVTMGKSKVNGDPIWSSPGVGWIRVDGNFTKSMFGGTDSFLWYRPARTRPDSAQLVTPQKATVALTDDVRLTRLIAAVRQVLRHYIPVEDMKRLAGLKMEDTELATSKAVAESVRSERMLDYAALFHRYERRGQMNSSRWASLLTEVGIKVTKTDANNCFNFFDSNHEGVISMEEFTTVLAFTDHEIDIAVDSIRNKLLNSCAQTSQQSNSSRGVTSLVRSNTGAIGASSITQHPDVGKNIIRENVTLSNIFQIVNAKGDDILSLDELMDLAARLEIFLTEEETRKVHKIMDLNNDDRVTEQEFIAFMRATNMSSFNKAHRVYDAVTLLRRWLVRGAGDKGEAHKQWADMKKHHEKSFSQKFPGFLTAQVLQLQLGILGLRLSALEARELSMLMAPDKNGRINQAELHAFMVRTTRTVGELTSLMNRELFGPLVTAYQAYQREFKLTGRDDTDRALLYRTKLDEIKLAVEGIYTKLQAKAAESKAAGGDDIQTRQIPQQTLQSVNVDPRLRKTSFELVPLAQLRAGLHDALMTNKATEKYLPSLEEYALLAVLVDADVTDGDIHGVRPKAFIEGLCKYIVEHDLGSGGDHSNFDIIVRQLKLQIYREAKSRTKDTKTKKPDYRAVFDLFDSDHNGSISLKEFKTYLSRLQLLARLNEQQIDALLALFDKKKKKTIDFDDFQAFAEDAESTARADDALGEHAVSTIAASGKGGAAGGAGGPGGINWAHMDDNAIDDILDEADPEEAALLNGKPPISVTRNADTDWLAWHLFRQAYGIEPLDAEGVLTELESYCAEAEIAAQSKAGISVREFWNLLNEFKMQGNLTKAQFIKGVQLVAEAGHGQDEDRVDYVALIKIAVRMGRAFASQLQEKEREVDRHFAPLLSDLKKFFQAICNEPSQEKDNIPRYEKLFRRLDGDQDGMITPREFRIGLLRLQYKDFAAWTNRMVRRLFDECDRNKDGLLSINEFSLYILDRNPHIQASQPPSAATTGYLSRSQSRGFNRSEEMQEILRDHPNTAGAGGRYGNKNQLDLSDHEDGEDDEFFRRHRTLNDHQLLKKVTDTLLETVPNESGNAAKHFDEMRLSVRRFFQRSDPDFKGVSTEERFRSFLRRSGLQEALTAAELRRFTEKLKKKGVGRERHETFIDYEKLCQQLMASTESAPRSKAETIFYRFQDAAMTAAGANRSFLSLCSLMDPRLSGKLTKEELVHVAKMMDCPLTLTELDHLLELSPSGVVNRDSTIDYRAMQNMLETYPGRDQLTSSYHVPSGGAGFGGMAHSQSFGALPAYASPHKSLSLGNNTSMINPLMLTQPRASITTPLGFTISAPGTPYGNNNGGIGGNPLNQQFQQQQLGMQVATSMYGAPTGSLEKIARAALDRLRSQANVDPLNLRRRFEGFDHGNSGQVPTRVLQSLLEDYGVVLSVSELHSLMTLYGRPEDDRIFYDSLLRALEASPWPLPKGAHPGSLLGISLDTPAYVTQKVLQRYRELQQEGRGLRDLCETHDLDRTGQISASKFRDLVTRCQLLQSQHQLAKAMEDFSVVGDDRYIHYENFCDLLDRSVQNYQSLPLPAPQGQGSRANTPSLRRPSSGIAEEGGYFSTEEDDYNNNHNVRQSLQRFNQAHSERGGGRYPPAPAAYELERGSSSNYPSSHTDYALSPPKLSDSYSGNLSARSNTSNNGRYSTPTRGHGSALQGATSVSGSFNAPRTSPSKVGSRMWGSSTPLNKKGKAPAVNGDRWCCPVCLYVENPADIDNCVVCDSPNYALRKDYQLKEQCRNCTFLNGEFAEECEMCGEPLASPKMR